VASGTRRVPWVEVDLPSTVPHVAYAHDSLDSLRPLAFVRAWARRSASGVLGRTPTSTGSVWLVTSSEAGASSDEPRACAFDPARPSRLGAVRKGPGCPLARPELTRFAPAGQRQRAPHDSARQKSVAGPKGPRTKTPRTAPKVSRAATHSAQAPRHVSIVEAHSRSDVLAS
jgi:hypothetical protein